MADTLVTSERFSIFHLRRQLETATPIAPVNDSTSTLNGKYGFAADRILTNASESRIRWMGIGIGGFAQISDTQESRVYPVRSTDGDLYSPIPFRIVPYEEDLTPAERENYAGRILYTQGSETYVKYMLRKVTLDDEFVKILRTDPVTGIESEYAINQADMSPTPPSFDDTGIVTADNLIKVQTTISCTVTHAEVAEAINVLYNGEMWRARISEYALYRGAEATITAKDANNNDFSYTEGIGIQMAYKQTSLGDNLTTPGSNQTKVFKLGVTSKSIIETVS